jgi:LCP family protein required for cell wall assembly
MGRGLDMFAKPPEGSEPEGGQPEGSEPKRGKAKRRLRQLAAVVLVLAVLGGIAGLGAAYLLASHLSGNVHRIDAFDGLDPSTRPSPAPADDGTETFLALGVDVRSDYPTTGDAAVDPDSAMNDARSDAIMLIRFNPDQHYASVVSIPRDSWVPIPGHGTNKINAAYAFGGPSLLIATVEKLTNIRVDHFLLVDFAGFKSIVDSLRGVDVQVAESTDVSGVMFHKGLNHLDGTEALAYVRQRHGLPGSDFDRVRRQQNFLRAVMTKVAKINPAGDPLRTYRLLDAMTQAVTVDDQISTAELRDLALSAAKLRSGSVWFLTAPVKGTGWEGNQSVVYLNTARANELWKAMRENTMSAYVAAHKSDLLSSSPR